VVIKCTRKIFLLFDAKVPSAKNASEMDSVLQGNELTDGRGMHQFFSTITSSYSGTSVNTMR